MKSLFFLFSFIFLIALASAQFGYDNPNLPSIEPAVIVATSGSSFDNSTGSVNNSQFLRGYTPQDFIDWFVDIGGDTMTGTLYTPAINISDTLNVSGKSWFLDQVKVSSGNGAIVGSNSAGSLVLETSTGQAGSVSFGNTADIGISRDGTVNGYNYNGAMIFKQKTSNPTSEGEFIFIEENGNWRFALPSSAVGHATYNPRSMIIAGVSKNNDSNFHCADWGFDELLCDTANNGADLGVQRDIQVLVDAHIGNNITVGGEVNGDMYVKGFNDRQSTVITSGSRDYFEYGRTDLSTSKASPEFTRSGSISGLSVNFDTTVGVQGTMYYEIRLGNIHLVNKSRTANFGIPATYTNSYTFPRGDYTFNAGQQLNTNFYWIGQVGSSITVNDIMVDIDYYYD